MPICVIIFFAILGLIPTNIYTGLLDPVDSFVPKAPIASNPAAVMLGGFSGDLGRLIGIPRRSGVTFGGFWSGDFNVCNKTIDPQGRYKLTGNNLLVLDLSIDLGVGVGFDGSSLCFGFLRFDGQPTNVAAGTLQGYNNLPGLPPLHRSEFYQLWYRQKMFDGKVSVRMGKMVPVNDFGNIVRPLLLQDEIVLTTGIMFRPIFSNPTTFGVMPGYYNSAYGITTILKPIHNFYIEGALYDGSLALGYQTGQHVGPLFKALLGLAETGVSWHAGPYRKPGNISVGGWWQTGRLLPLFGVIPTPAPISEHGAQGLYAFGTQRLWYAYPQETGNMGIVGYWHMGINNSKTLPIDKYIGGGISFLGMAPWRGMNICGLGVASSWLNTAIFPRANETMFQAYYETHLIGHAFFIGALSYIPNPALSRAVKNVWAVTARVLTLF